MHMQGGLKIILNLLTYMHVMYVNDVHFVRSYKYQVLSCPNILSTPPAGLPRLTSSARKSYQRQAWEVCQDFLSRIVPMLGYGALT